MARSRWIEQIMLERIWKASELIGLEQQLKFLMQLRIERHHDALRSMIAARSNKLNAHQRKIIEDSIDYITNEERLSKKRKNDLASKLIRTMPEDTDTSAIRAIIGASTPPRPGLSHKRRRRSS